LGAGERRVRHYLPPWRIDVTVRPGVRVPRGSRRLTRAMAAALEAAAAPAPAALGLILADDRELRRLNRRAMSRGESTDVLSFPLLPPAAFPAHPGQDCGARMPSREPSFARPPGQRLQLGDVVVSVERALAQAAAGRGGQTGDVRWTGPDELRLLVIHGTLHVCGWDHALPVEEAAMRGLERRLLAAPGAR
jgi:probable rRNA maturation factor